MGLTLQERDKTDDTDGCAAMKDGLHVEERSVGAREEHRGLPM